MKYKTKTNQVGLFETIYLIHNESTKDFTPVMKYSLRQRRILVIIGIFWELLIWIVDIVLWTNGCLNFPVYLQSSCPYINTYMSVSKVIVGLGLLTCHLRVRARKIGVFHLPLKLPPDSRLHHLRGIYTSPALRG